MARFDFPGLETAPMAGAERSDELFFQLGLRHSAGDEANLIEAHKWFNLAASRGHREAAVRRGELAAEMSAIQIAEAQRAARAFLAMH
ncbi:MAG: sel1 repeat family protein [Labrys sp. (in: a-proteobacteria)]